MKAYGEELRRKVLGAKKREESSAEIARWFGISVSVIDRWWKSYRESGREKALRVGGHRKSRLEGYDAILERWIDENKSITLAEISARCRKELGIDIKRNAIDHRLRKLGLTHKKNDARRGARAARREGKEGRPAGRTKEARRR